MKKLLLIFSLILTTMEIFGQSRNESGSQTLNRTSHSLGDASISVSPNVLFGSTDATIIAGGMKLRLFVGDRLSFDSDLVLGPDYVRFGPGLIGLPLWCIGISSGFNFSDENSIGSVLFMGAIMLLSAEHFAYHIPIQNNTDISPYLSLLRFKQISGLLDPKYTDGINSSVYGAIGLEMNKYYKRFVFSPYIDYDVSYTGQGHGFNLGLNLGYYFPSDK
jgi:hypothetical protein